MQDEKRQETPRATPGPRDDAADQRASHGVRFRNPAIGPDGSLDRLLDLLAEIAISAAREREDVIDAA